MENRTLEPGKAIALFVGVQADIYEEFGFGIPDGCTRAYMSKQKPNQSGEPRVTGDNMKHLSFALQSQEKGKCDEIYNVIIQGITYG